MKKEYIVTSTTESGQIRIEGGFATQGHAEEYIEILVNQYGPVENQDLDDKVIKFNIQVDFVLL